MDNKNLQKEKMRSSFFFSFFLLFPTASVAFFKMMPIPYHTIMNVHRTQRFSAGTNNYNQSNNTFLNETHVIADGRAFVEWMRIK